MTDTINDQVAVKEELTAMVHETVASIEEINRTAWNTKKVMGNIKDSVNNITDKVNNFSEALVEQTGLFKAVTDDICDKLKPITDIAKTAEAQATKAKEHLAMFQEVTKAMNLVKDVIDYIKDITDQEKVINMNMKIQAAHLSGTNGGIKVIANVQENLIKNALDKCISIEKVFKTNTEMISKLKAANEEVIETSISIANNIINVKNTTDETYVGLAGLVDMSKETENQVNSIKTDLNSVNDSVEEVNNAIEENSAAVNQIQTAMKSIDNEVIKCLIES